MEAMLLLLPPPPSSSSSSSSSSFLLSAQQQQQQQQLSFCTSIRKCSLSSFTLQHPLLTSSTSPPHPQLQLPLSIKNIRRNVRSFKSLCGALDIERVESKPKKSIIAVTGASGFIGMRLVKTLVEGGHEIRVLSHSPSKARLLFPENSYPGVIIAEENDWSQLIQGSTGVVNLAGPPISTRWDAEVKAKIKTARVAVTRKVVEAINKSPEELRPSVLVSATAVGYYGTSEDCTFDEMSPSGQDYLSEVCQEWEAAAEKVDGGVRLVLVRIGVVLDKDGGALAKMVPIFKAFAGGPLGSGKQWFSWIHREDLVSLIIEALSNPVYKGVINGTAPNPVRMREMCDMLGAVLGRPSWLPVPEFALKTILGEGATMVLEGQRVIPKKAQALGFEFKYKYVADALKASLTA